MGDEQVFMPEETQATEAARVTVVKVNFVDGTITDQVQYENEGGIPKLFRELAKYAKKAKITSAVIMTIDEENSVEWMSVAGSEHHLALAALCLDDLKDDLKTKIFGEEEEEEE